jgi:hypothetical protein
MFPFRITTTRRTNRSLQQHALRSEVVFLNLLQNEFGSFCRVSLESCYGNHQLCSLYGTRRSVLTWLPWLMVCSLRDKNTHKEECGNLIVLNDNKRNKWSVMYSRRAQGDIACHPGREPSTRLVASVCSQQHARSDSECFSELASLVFVRIDSTFESYGSKASQLDCSCIREPLLNNTFISGEQQDPY